MTLDEMNKLREAAQAVVDRWYTPKWNWTHDAIGELIAAVRDALAEDQLDEMWVRLAQHQPYADQRGYGPEWARMCRERTPEAAWAAADATAWAAARGATDAADAAWAAAADATAWAAAKAADAVEWIEKAEGRE